MTTYYCSPTGNAGNDGLTSATPKPFASAYTLLNPGDFLNCLAGDYVVSVGQDLIRSGSPGLPLTIRGGINGTARFMYTSSTPLSAYIFNLPAGFNVHDVVIDSLSFDGNNKIVAGIGVRAGCHHVTINNCVIKNMGAAGVSTVGADYITVTNCKISHVGYEVTQSNSSGISLNNQAQVALYDAGTGIHNIIAYNICTGAVDKTVAHTDGNGIILDGYLGNTLIVGNICYNNGGRGIEAFDMTTAYAPQGVWIVNNTCYKNVLDKTLASWPGYGEFVVANCTSTINFINNVAVPWDVGTYTYQAILSNANLSTGLNYAKNIQIGGAGLGGFGGTLVTTANDAAQVFTGDPLFLNPPVIAAGTDGQYATSIAAESIGSAFTTTTNSPARQYGRNPTTVGAPNATIASQLATYAGKDIIGATRPQGALFDVGAYETSVGDLIQLEQQAENGLNGSSIAVVLPYLVDSGNCLVAAVTVNTGGFTVSGITDTRGNTWVVGPVLFNGQRVEIWYALNCAAGATTVTTVITGVRDIGVTVMEFNGVKTAAALDSSQTVANTAVTTSLSGSISPAQIDVLVAALAANQANGALVAASGFIKLLNPDFSTIHGRAAYKVSAAASQQASWTTASGTAPGAILALKANLQVVTPPLARVAASVRMDDIVPKNNFIATVSPTVNDDSSLGYSAGSLWSIATAAGNWWGCVDGTIGAAVWKALS